MKRNTQHIWLGFSPEEGTNQILPPMKKDVLLYFPSISKNTGDSCIVMGYFRYLGSDRNQVTWCAPGVPRHGQPPVAWNDCLDDDLVTVHPKIEKLVGMKRHQGIDRNLYPRYKNEYEPDRPGKESPIGHDRRRLIRGFGDHYDFAEDSYHGRAYAYYEDGADEYWLIDRLDYEQVFIEEFFAEDGSFYDPDLSYEEVKEKYEEFLTDIAFGLYNDLEKCIYEVKNEWKPEYATSKFIDTLPKLNRAKT